jgi:hypothetical protein
MIGAWWLVYTAFDALENRDWRVTQSVELHYLSQGQLTKAREAARALWAQLSAVRHAAHDGLLYPRDPQLIWKEPIV